MDAGLVAHPQRPPLLADGILLLRAHNGWKNKRIAWVARTEMPPVTQSKRPSCKGSWS